MSKKSERIKKYKNIQNPKGKSHNVGHPIKDYQTCNEVVKYNSEGGQ